jgi:hypothetical protein
MLNFMNIGDKGNIAGANSGYMDFFCAFQGNFHYFILQGLDYEDPVLEQSCDDGTIRANRWASRTVKITGTLRGHTPRGRVQNCLEQVGLESVTIEERPLYYLTIVAVKESLPGMDYLVASHPTPRVTPLLYGRLPGIRTPIPVRTRLLYLLDDLGVARSFLPEVPR